MVKTQPALHRHGSHAQHMVSWELSRELYKGILSPDLSPTYLLLVH